MHSEPIFTAEDFLKDEAFFEGVRMLKKSDFSIEPTAFKLTTASKN